MFFKHILLLTLSTLLFASSCKSDNPTPTATSPTEETGATAEKAAQKDEPGAKAAMGDIYPGFNFSALEPSEQERFVEVAKAELCPCPNMPESLHECLQKADQRCDLSEQAASHVAIKIKEGLNQTDTLASLASFLESTRKKHEFNLQNSPLKGSADADIIIVEFADFECPHCREFSKTLDKAHKLHGDKIGVYFKHFPLSAHSNGRLAAQAAVAAHNQKKFWPMHDLVFENQRSLSPDRIMSFAQQIGLNMEKFTQDLNSAMTVAAVQADRAEGEKAQLTGTPTIYINGVKYMGDRSEEGFLKHLEELLKE